MPCTTLLVGKKATYDGSTMIARNEDSGAGHYNPKKFVVVEPQDQPRHYKSKGRISNLITRRILDLKFPAFRILAVYRKR